ncbi:serine hydrolase [Nonomuraea spiralis]|uniref:Serine hydrolase n=1 Tax=Nonomuraea spiralis TaxID=46182 RepID=A0ABV5IA96_9ACTN|nr:serine hydrolase [Nonomuraea spiralis]GGT04683.1 hypothetical protein GCM10010176_056220 [Nonomuraea spiralis]
MSVLERRMRDVLGGFVARGEVPGLVGLVHHRGETHLVAEGTLESGGGAPGLLTTPLDYAAFCRMLLAKGHHDGGRLLSRASVELMTTDHLSPTQKAGSETFPGEGGWGFGMQVDTRMRHLYTRPGRFGWTGGLGTTAYTDPSEDLVGLLFTQVAMTSPVPPRFFEDFWTVTYTSLDQRQGPFPGG